MAQIIKISSNPIGRISKAVKEEHINLAIKCLANGCVIALPTDTIYGLACKVTSSESLEKIFAIKGRDRSKPLSVCVSSIEDINSIADTSHINQNLIRSLLPGRLTILLKRAKDLNPDLNRGVETVGIRVPDHDFIRSVSERVGPLALTSANRSGEKSPLRIEDFEGIWPQITCIFDDGQLNSGQNSEINRLGSTVIDLSHKNTFKIVRDGCVLERTINILKHFGYNELGTD